MTLEKSGNTTSGPNAICKVAVGVFHVNLFEILGDPTTAHRYCSQVLVPLLDILESNEDYRCSIEVAGMSLEFLSEQYPRTLERFRTLVLARRIELITTTYAPTAWIAFPGRDLEHSIRLHREVVEKLGLPNSRVFFAQEGFTGQGLKRISDWCNIVLCKDSSLDQVLSGDEQAPIYRFGDNSVLVIGSNHLLHEIASLVGARNQNQPQLRMSLHAEARIEEAVNSATHSSDRYVKGSLRHLQWRWFHLGAAQHMTTAGRPRENESFFADPAWMQLTVTILDNLLNEGYGFSFVEELVSELEPITSPQRAPAITEASWTGQRNGGLSRWMGRQENRWDAGPGLLTLAWRSRSAIRQIEEALGPNPSVEPELRDIWREQILAECSGPFSAAAFPCEVAFGREQVDRVLTMCTKLSDGHGLQSDLAGTNHVSPFWAKPCEPLVEVQLVGADGAVVWRTMSEETKECAIRFRSEERNAGVRFRRSDRPRLAYCPSGLETELIKVEMSVADPPRTLPLANGLIEVDSATFLIRDNCTVSVAAKVDPLDQWVSFVMEGIPEGRVFEWRFVGFSGAEDEAIRLANRVNLI